MSEGISWPKVPAGQGLVGSVGLFVAYHPLAMATTEEPPTPTIAEEGGVVHMC